MQIIIDAIKQVVDEFGQDEALSKALITWYSELANGNETLTDSEAVRKRLGLLIEKTILSPSQCDKLDLVTYEQSGGES